MSGKRVRETETAGVAVSMCLCENEERILMSSQIPVSVTQGTFTLILYTIICNVHNE